VSRIRPFRALRYDPARVDLSRVLVPPYDVIAPGERGPLFDRDPHSAIRLELTRRVEDEAHTDYREVAGTLERWQRSGVLVREARPALYALRQTFDAPGGERTAREGFFALLGLEDYGRRVVLPHERTLAGPKADRLKLLRASRANLSSVFLLYEDREGSLRALVEEALRAAPLAEARDASGIAQRLARIDDPARVEAVRAFLSERPLVIADGHHRYETALAYRDERRAAEGGERPDAPEEWILAYLANAFAPGTLLLPIHRLIRKGAPPTEALWRERLRGWREERVAAPSADAVPALLERHLAPLADRCAFAADDGSGVLRIFSRARRGPHELPVRALHEEVVAGVFGLDEAAVREGAIEYPKSALEAARELREGRASAALYLHPLDPADVFRVTAAGELLPQKSTFFYPKLPTGLVFRLLEAES
jgi:uncharacterized protein (DUF1015 family)